MPHWPIEIQRAFLALASHAFVAGPICRAVAERRFDGIRRLRDICSVAGLAEARSSSVEAALRIGADFGLFVRCGDLEWRPSPIAFGELATSLEAVALYREKVHADLDVVDVVFTPPGKQSQRGDALRIRGRVEGDLEHTEAIMRHLASHAATRFVVLSPSCDAC